MLKNVKKFTIFVEKYNNHEWSSYFTSGQSE